MDHEVVTRTRFISLGLLSTLALALLLPSRASAQVPPPKSVLYLWAGDKGISTGVSPITGKEFDAPDYASPFTNFCNGGDALYKVNADPSSVEYGKVLEVHQVFTPPVVGNEPHHMQPFTAYRADGSQCNHIFAGGLFDSYWWNFTLDPTDQTKIAVDPDPLCTGLPGAGVITLLQQTASIPDAAFVMPDCTALGTNMGGRSINLGGTCLPFPFKGPDYGGSHGGVIWMDPTGTTALQQACGDRPIDATCESQWDVINPTVLPLDALNALPLPLQFAPNPNGSFLGKLGGPFTEKTCGGDPNCPHDCMPSNPHGIWARPDLCTLITSDYATPAQVVYQLPQVSEMAKLTVRHYNLSDACAPGLGCPASAECIIGGQPRPINGVYRLPTGPRNESNEGHKENVGVMECATTEPGGLNGPGGSDIGYLNSNGATPPNYIYSKGGVATTMCGGALFWNCDISDPNQTWREVYDYTAAGDSIDPTLSTAGCSGDGAISMTPDNRFSVHAIIGREITQVPLIGLGTGSDTQGFPGMLVSLAMTDLITHGCPSQTDPVEAATHCNIDNMHNGDPTQPVDEVHQGGSEADCPKLADVLPVPDETNGGPHFYSFDHDNWNAGTHRLSFFDYFVTESGVGGNLDVCMVNFNPTTGAMAKDTTFPSVAVAGEQRNPAGSGCISFNRGDWPAPRGPQTGPAKPHYGLFAGRLAVGPSCGDGTCSGAENCANCATDCGCTGGNTCQSGVCAPPCGDGTCNPNIGENCATCAADCGCTGGNTCQNGVCAGPCGDGTCDTAGGENCATCATDCGCTGGNTCQNGVCAPPCGDGTCDPSIGENCATCAADCGCTGGNTCQNGVCAGPCGDGTCDTAGGENCATCATDCGCTGGNTCQNGVCAPPCGDGTCDPTIGENCATCAADCGCTGGDTCQSGVCANPCGDGTCDPNLGENCSTCSADCGCTGGNTCQNGQCQPPPPHCGDTICDATVGEDCATCPGDCGTCQCIPEGQTCLTGAHGKDACCADLQCTGPGTAPKTCRHGNN